MKLRTRFLRTALCCLLTIGGTLIPSSARAANVPTPSCSTTYTSYIKVTWAQSSSSIYGYVIRRSTSSTYSTSSFLKYVSSPSTTTLYDYTPVRGEKYYYWVCPVYRVSGSTYYHWSSTSAYDWGIRPVTVPTPTCSTTYTSYIKVTWAASSDATYGYVIRRGISPTYSSSTFLKYVSSPSTTTLYDYTPVAGRRYYYWVCPVYRVSGSTYYHWSSTLAYDWGMKPSPIVPTPTCSRDNSSYIKVSWAVSSSSVYGYVIRRGTSSSYSSSTYLKYVSSPSTTTLYDYTPVAGRTYYYWVCPVYKVSGTTYYHWSSASSYGSGMKPGTSVPKANCARITINGSSRVLVSWLASSSATYGYVIRRGTSSTYSSSKYIAYVTSPSATSYNDYSTLTTGATYYYWVCPVYKVSGKTYYHYYDATQYGSITAR